MRDVARPCDNPRLSIARSSTNGCRTHPRVEECEKIEVVSEAATTVSERESEVLLGVADHLTNAEIGRRLHISVRTVESHVSSLLRKLGVSDRRALARYARGLAGEGLRPGDDVVLEQVGLPAQGSGATRPGALRGAPAALTSFVGRHSELDAVAAALGSARLVNLVGPAAWARPAWPSRPAAAPPVTTRAVPGSSTSSRSAATAWPRPSPRPSAWATGPTARWST